MKKIILILIAVSSLNAQNIWKLVGDNILPYNSTYLTAIRLSTATPAQLGAIRYGSGTVQYYNGSSWISLSGSGGGISAGNADSLGGQPASKYFLKSDTVNFKGGLLKNADSTTIRNYSNALYQTKGTYLVTSDSTLIRSYSASLYQPKGTYLVPSDSTTIRSYSNSLYWQKSILDTSLLHAGKFAVINDSISSHNTRINALVSGSGSADSSVYVNKAGIQEISGTKYFGIIKSSGGVTVRSGNYSAGGSRIYDGNIDVGVTGLYNGYDNYISVFDSSINSYIYGAGLISLDATNEISTYSSDLNPSTSNNYTLGSSSKKWDSLYVNSIKATTLNLGGASPDSQLTVNLGASIGRGLKVGGATSLGSLTLGTDLSLANIDTSGTTGLRSIYVPYSGANATLNLGAQNFTTTGTITSGAINGNTNLSATSSPTFGGMTLNGALNINYTYSSSNQPLNIRSVDGYGLYVHGENQLNFDYGRNEATTFYLNWGGYNAGNTQFRNLNIGDGKNNSVALFTGSDKSLTLNGALSLGTNSITAGSIQTGDYIIAGTYFSQTVESNTTYDALSIRNTSTGTSAKTRFRLGNNGSATGFHIDLNGGNFTGSAHSATIMQEYTAPLIFGTDGTARWTIGADGSLGGGSNSISSVGSITASGNISQTGSQKAIVTKTGDYTATSNDYTILCDNTTNITITLPASASNTGRIYNIKKINSSGATVTLDGNGSETIDGNLTITFNTQWTSYQIQSTGTSWVIL